LRQGQEHGSPAVRREAEEDWANNDGGGESAICGRPPETNRLAAIFRGEAAQVEELDLDIRLGREHLAGDLDQAI
jgi:hypothetical protein